MAFELFEIVEGLKKKRKPFFVKKKVGGGESFFQFGRVIFAQFGLCVCPAGIMRYIANG